MRSAREGCLGCTMLTQVIFQFDASNELNIIDEILQIHIGASVQSLYVAIVLVGESDNHNLGFTLFESCR